MPPKRKPKKEDDSNKTNYDDKISTITVSENDVSDQISKKLKTNNEDLNPLSLPTNNINISNNSNSGNDSEAALSVDSDTDSDSDLPECMYGAKCYRKNPDHFKQFKHPKTNSSKSSLKKTSSSSSSSPSSATSKSSSTTTTSKTTDIATNDKDSNTNSNIATATTTAATTNQFPMKRTDSSLLDNYRRILQCALAKNKVSADDKRLLRTYRKGNNVTEEDHYILLKKLGWTEEEYDDGEKKDDEIDLEEERKFHERDEFTVITIKKEDTHKSKEHQNVFAKVSAKFYETMSKAQANFTISAIGVIVNSKLRKPYLEKKMDFYHKFGEEVEEIYGFHGTSKESISAIAKTGFLHPDDLAKLKMTATASKGKGKGKKNKVMAKKPVELLDDGYFGKGIYFTLFSDYALWYSEERESDQIMLCKLLPGKRFQCTQRMDGQGLKKGFDSHSSPKGNEIVLFSSDQILPRYVITFVSKTAEEREQES